MLNYSAFSRFLILSAIVLMALAALTGCGSGGGGGGGSTGGASGGGSGGGTAPDGRDIVAWSIQSPTFQNTVVGQAVTVSLLATLAVRPGVAPPSTPISISFAVNGSTLPTVATATLTPSLDNGGHVIPNLYRLEVNNHTLFTPVTAGPLSVTITVDSTHLTVDDPALISTRSSTVPVTIAPVAAA